jgi:hypothetical protein
MKPIKQILMERDRLSDAEAQELIDECTAEMQASIARGELEEAEEIFNDYTGLEPDYIFELDIW